MQSEQELMPIEQQLFEQAFREKMALALNNLKKIPPGRVQKRMYKQIEGIANELVSAEKPDLQWLVRLDTILAAQKKTIGRESTPPTDEKVRKKSHPIDEVLSASYAVEVGSSQLNTLFITPPKSDEDACSLKQAALEADIQRFLSGEPKQERVQPPRANDDKPQTSMTELLTAHGKFSTIRKTAQWKRAMRQHNIDEQE